MTARNRSIKAKEGESVVKLLAAFVRKADESTIGKLIVEEVILLSARSQSDGGKVLRAAAQTYGVDTDAVALKVKQELAAKEKARIFIVNVKTGDYRKLTAGMGNGTAPAWSHDGKWIYFESKREAGAQIWRVPASGGSANRLTKTDGVAALESVDGKALYFSKFSDPGLWSLPLAGGRRIESFAVSLSCRYLCCGQARNLLRAAWAEVPGDQRF